MHVFRTQFAPPNQTQAFFPGGQGDPGKQPPTPIPPFQQNPYAAYPRQGNSQDVIASLLNGLPAFACFLIGFFTNLLAIALLVGYFGYAPARDPRKGWATAFGMMTPMAFWFLFVLITMIHK